MNQDMDMTHTDSELCTFLEFPSKAFPSFCIIQDNLKSFYPRFKRTVEDLPVCLKWKDLVEDISKKVGCLEKNMPALILFGEKHTMIHTEQIVADINRLGKNEFKRGTFLRKDLPSRLSVDAPQVLVYRCSSDQVVQEIILLLETELPVTKTDNVLMLIDVGGKYENDGKVLQEKIITSLTDAPRKFWKERIIVITVNQAISTKISNHLEMCILEEFKRIEVCIREVLSIQRNVEGISTFERDLISVLNKFFQNKIVVQDLMDLAYQEGSDQFFQEQIILLIQREVSAALHAEFKMAAGDIHAMLEEMKFIEKCKKQILPNTWFNIELMLSGAYMESQPSEEPMGTDYETGQSPSMKPLLTLTAQIERQFHVIAS